MTAYYRSASRFPARSDEVGNLMVCTLWVGCLRGRFVKLLAYHARFSEEIGPNTATLQVLDIAHPEACSSNGHYCCVECRWELEPIAAIYSFDQDVHSFQNPGRV